jgi:tetratricopeptide (TPR) repeat protein
VAYGQIPRGARADKHRAAADWIGSLGGERLEDRAELLAHHYLAALELARAAGMDTSDLEGPARLALRGAGDRSLGLAAYAAAERAYEAAVELWPEDDPELAMLLYQYGRALYLHSDVGDDVLGRARDLLLEQGDVETAAVAELHIGDMVWRRGEGKKAQSHFDRAESLIEGRPASTEVARAKAHLSRYLMVTGRSEDSIRVGREALATAETLGADEIRAMTLNTVGTARTSMGDLGGFDDIEKSIEVAESANLPWHVGRGHINMGVSLFYAGHLTRALEEHQFNLEYTQRYAMEGGIIWTKAEVAFDLCLVGRWDEALEIADGEIARMEAGAPHYVEVQHRQARSRIRQGRGDLEGAIEDAERAVEVGRGAGDPQALLPAIAEHARVLMLLGQTDEAVASIDEILDSVDSTPSMDWAWWIVPAAIVLADVDRGEEILALGGAELPSRWVQAGRLWAAGDLAGAADLFAEIGSAPDEAYARQREAERLVAAGRRAEAEAFLSGALELYRMMGATAFIQEAEQLLAPPA